VLVFQLVVDVNVVLRVEVGVSTYQWCHQYWFIPRPRNDRRCDFNKCISYNAAIYRGDTTIYTFSQRVELVGSYS